MARTPPTFAPLTPALVPTTGVPPVLVDTPPVPPPGLGQLGLTVEPEAPRGGYDRDLFEHWVDADGDGCDTRQEVLERDSLVPVTVSASCDILAGDWLSYLDGYSTPDPGELHVDHTVALAEAWDSGAWAWDATRRQAFANDLDTPGALRAVSATENQRKSDRDPADYQPVNAAANCEFARSWVMVKQHWELSVDPVEEGALLDLLAAC